MAMTLVSTVTLSGTAASIQFTNIPQTGKDLFVVFSCRSDRAGQQVDTGQVYFNSDTTDANYSGRILYGDGSGSATFSLSLSYDAYWVPAAANTANIFGSSQILIPNYTSSTAKSFSVDFTMERDATQSYLGITAGLWSGTNAITSLTIEPTSTRNFVQHSTASLYIIS